MATNNKTCILCQKKYTYCGSCRSHAISEPSWRNAWDTENCKNIFEILATYINGNVSAVDAKKQLIEFDLKDKDSYSPKMKKAADEIMAAEIPAEEVTMVSPAVVETDPVDVATEEIAEILEKSTEKAPAEPKKKNRRRN